MKFLRVILTVVSMSVVSLLSAQTQPQEPRRPDTRFEKFTAKERAEKRTRQMDEVVALDNKQYKKIYKIFLREEETKDAAMGNGAPMGPPPGGTGGGRPSHGGGFNGGPGFGAPPSGGGMPPHGNGPSVPTIGGRHIDSDEYLDAREEKFKKILTPDQYARWRKTGLSRGFSE